MRVRSIAALGLVLGCVSSALATLGTPTNLAAVSASATSIRLSWVDTNGNPTEDGFSIERSLTATSGFAVVATTGPNATSYVDGGLVTGRTYYYRVQTKRAQQTSPYSNVASAVPLDVTAPTVPNPLNDTVMSCSQINLTWGASTDAESGVGSYRVYRNNVFVKQVAAPATSTADTGLAASAAYTYQVSAVDNAGNESSRSQSASGITPTCPTTTLPTTTTTSTAIATTTTVKPTTTSTSTSTTTAIVPTTTSTSSVPTTTLADRTAPSVPSGLTTTVASCSQINLVWIGSSDAGGSGLAGYKVYRNNVFVKQVATTSTSDTGLTGASVYSYQVSAVDNAGNESARSATSSANTPTCPTGGGFVWQRQMGGTVLADSVVPYAVAVDGSGNSFVTGVMYGTVNFGAGNVTSAGRADMFLAKYSAANVVQWVKRFGDAADQFGNAVAVDASGNVYVTGYFFGTVDFGGGPLTGNSYDIILAKYSPTGVHLWSKAIGGASTDMGQAIAVDAGGNVIVGGQFAMTVDFGGGPLTSAGGYDGFIAKYNTNGAHVWSRRVGGTSLDMITGLGVDSSGNPTVVGYFQGTSNFGGADMVSAGSADVVVARYTSAGAFLWSNRYGDLDDQRAYAAAVDGSGNVALTGYFNGTISFGVGSPTYTNAGGADMFVVKLTPGGSYGWSRAIGSSQAYGQVGEGVAFDGAGNVLLTGEVVQGVDFGGGLVIPSVITYDAFVAKYSSTGVYQWAKRWVSNFDDHGNAVAADASGNVLAVGDFYESENFGGVTLLSPGGSDGFLLKLTP